MCRRGRPERDACDHMPGVAGYAHCVGDPAAAGPALRSVLSRPGGRLLLSQHHQGMPHKCARIL